MSESTNSARGFIEDCPNLESLDSTGIFDDEWTDTDSDIISKKHWLYLREQIIAGQEPIAQLTGFDNSCMLLLVAPLQMSSEQAQEFKALKAKFTAWFEDVLANRVEIKEPAKQLEMELKD